MCPVFVSSELLLSTHLPTSEGWTAELTVDCGKMVPTVGLEPRTEDLTLPLPFFIILRLLFVLCIDLYAVYISFS